MSFVKTKLKASRDAIQAKAWTEGAEEAREVLEYEPDNYTALIFRGLALLHLEQFEKSEEAYQKAIKVQPSHILAWQGLEKFYLDRKQYKKQAEVLHKIMDIYLDADDAIRCAETLQRLVALQREEGTRLEIASTLSLYLPSSRYYSLLCKLPRPDQTNPKATSTFNAEMTIHVNSLSVLTETISLFEENEQIIFDRELEQRRTRLISASKSREDLRNEIGVEIWRGSRLPELYESVLSHIDASDDSRREAERKLFFYKYRILQALPNPDAKISRPTTTAAKHDDSEIKEQQRKEKSQALHSVKELASGIVSINVANELAWRVHIEWNNIFSPVEISALLLRSYINHFPRSGLSSSFKALLEIRQDEQYLSEEKERHEKLDVEFPSSEPLSLAIAGIEECSDSIIAHRIAASLFMIDTDWISCSDLASIGLNLVKSCENDFSVNLSRVRAGLELNLATALTHLFPPQYHLRALRLAESVLIEEEGNIDATLCKAYVAQAAGRWEQARKFFVEVQDRFRKISKGKMVGQRSLSISADPSREARLEVAWCDVKLHRLQQAKEQLQMIVKEFDASSECNDEDRAKAWWRLGSCICQMVGYDKEKVFEAFTCFITALKRNSACAPAFTSLGTYYKLYSSPPDMIRSAKCFQKAFELDAKENEAAYELARSYADDEDWDLVYLVAQRTIEGEGGGLALRGEIQSQHRHTTQNVWAWTAIGSSELSRKNFEKAIIAYQIALRTFSNDGQIWMKLGEAYTATGRLTAGQKTFEKAAEILKDTKEAWQPMLNIANIKNQQGMFEESLEILLGLCKQEPEIIGLLLTCAETRLLLALDQTRQGYSERGMNNVYFAIRAAQDVIKSDPSLLAAWKVISDGLFYCSDVHMEDLEQSRLFDLIDISLKSAKGYDVDKNLPSISAVTLQICNASKDRLRLLKSSIYLNKLRVLLHHGDEQVSGSVWMDLAIGLHKLCIIEEIGEESEESTERKSQAIACVKEALKMEPGNELYWCALGNLVFDKSLKLTQHFYSKAIEIDPRDAIPWTSLGFLYLEHNDINLAKECFMKAQTLDPECVEAWIGRALLAKKLDQQDQYKILSQHAFAVDEAHTSIESAYVYSASLLTSDSNMAASQVDLLSASFAMTSYLSHSSNDVSALHLSALYSERLKDLKTSAQRIAQASSILESQYEQDESVIKAHLFAICMANLGRIELKRENFQAAKESFEICLGLLVAEGDERNDKHDGKSALLLTRRDLVKARIGAHCGKGQLQFAMGEKQNAMEEIKQALEDEGEIDNKYESDGSREELIILLAKMQWLIGDCQGAESTVMEALVAQPKSVKVLSTLGSISCINSDQEQLKLVERELLGIFESRESDEISRRDVISFLTFAKLCQLKYQKALDLLRKEASKSLVAHSELVKLLLLLTLKEHNAGAMKEERLTRFEEYSQEALTESIRLMYLVQHDPSMEENLLLQSLKYCSLAYALRYEKTKAIDMATRCTIMQPGLNSNWSLLQQLHELFA